VLRPVHHVTPWGMRSDEALRWAPLYGTRLGRHARRFRGNADAVLAYFLPGTAGVSSGFLRLIFDPSQTSGSYLRPTTRSFIGISALSVILMCSGQTSVQHLVMLQ